MGNAAGLSEEQRRALDHLRSLPILGGFYLAGGAALGIRLGHRQSDDLDFFSRTPSADFQAIKDALATRFDRVEVRAETDAALHLLCDGFPVDFVRYPYPLLEPAEASELGVDLAGLHDLASMKLSAISRRGLRRDFWDLFEILHSGIPLRDCGEAYLKRFGIREADLYHVLRALTYFDDAERDPVYPRGMDEKKWGEVKAYLRREAPKLVQEEA